MGNLAKLCMTTDGRVLAHAFLSSHMLGGPAFRHISVNPGMANGR